MDFLISGASGLIGKQLKKDLELQGHTVRTLVRNKANISETAHYWDPQEGILEKEPFAKIDAIINLSGESISSLWTSQKKERILQSRIATTRLLVAKTLEFRPDLPVFLSASAIGYYGNSETQIFDENSPLANSFLAQVCDLWEKELNSLERVGIRTVKVRIGLVLSKDGGGLKQMLLPFKLGLGGKIGSGQQYWSWIDIRDLSNLFIFSATNQKVKGIINGVSPNAVTNEKFSKTLASVLNRPAWIPVPGSILRILMGEMAEAIILSGANVKPNRVQELGFIYRYPQLEDSLRSLLKTTE